MTVRAPAKVPFQFCTQCGAAHLRASSAQEFICPSCGFRHFINPIAAVAVILANADGEVLLIRRARDPGRGLLGLPGGFVDVGETAEEALRREIEEEVHLRVSELTYFVSLPNRYPFQGIATPVLDFFYTSRMATFEGARAKEEIVSLEPARLAQLDFSRIAFESNREALRRFKDANSSADS